MYAIITPVGRLSIAEGPRGESVMHKAIKITIMLLVMLSLLCAGAAAESTPSVLEISNIFVYTSRLRARIRTRR